ncbi:ABC transporter ATP-binding protein [Devriesea agamarum]|uniref:ABC transporter ATP-binding protein n=1 Tax=Devriesea agamarum TaxID=472569 RepID=UPI00071CBC78|nr:ABC transporter ATP-binding protein [Devriesea agamarum]
MTINFDTLIQAENLSRRYGDIQALDQVSIEVSPGEVVVLAGPNGCGKTTLVETLMGLRRVHKGTVRVLGVSPRSGRQHIAPHVGLTLQGAALHSQVTAKEHFAFVAALYGRSKADVEQVMQQLQLTDFAGRRYGKLSGGQQRRVQVGAALLSRPRLLVLDEPTSGVDLESRGEMWAAVRSCTVDAGTGVLITTHDLTEAEEYGDRVVIMRAGKIVAQGAPIEIVTRCQLHAVVSVRYGGLPSGGIPQRDDLCLLKEDAGSVVIGCSTEAAEKFVLDWAHTNPSLRHASSRAPILADAYLYAQRSGENGAR